MIDNDDFDIFHWANQADAKKHNLSMELFLFNKHYTPYFISTLSADEDKLRSLMLYEYIHTTQKGAATGMQIRNQAAALPEENTLMYADLEAISRANTFIYLIEAERSQIEEFSHNEHDIKRMHGIVARFTDPDNPNTKFYTVKQLQRTQILTKAVGWQLSGDKLRSMEPEATLKIPSDNHVLIAGDKVFAFNQSKFLSLFKQDLGMETLLILKCKWLSSRYGLKLPEGLTLEKLASDDKSLAKAIVELEFAEPPSIGEIQDFVDNTGLALMADDSDGGFIIMDKRDLKMFVDILSDNYVNGGLSGDRYLATKKKRIDDDKQLNMNI